MIFPKGLNPTNGSWCLVTTRLGQMAHSGLRVLMMDDDAYFLGRLPADGCLSILKEKATAGEAVPDELEAIKDRLVRKMSWSTAACKYSWRSVMNKEKRGLTIQFWRIRI